MYIVHVVSVQEIFILFSCFFFHSGSSTKNSVGESCLKTNKAARSVIS